MTEKVYGWGLPIDISTHGYQIDNLLWVVHIFMAVLFVGWFGYLVYAIIRFRQRPGHERAHHDVWSAEHKKHFKFPTYAEVGIALFEIFLLCAFAFPIFSQIKNKFPDSADTLRLRVVAEQFAWNIHYSGKDGVFGKTDPKLMSPTNPLGLEPGDPAGKDDVTTINQFKIPVDTPIIVDLSSKDVIHSFGVPVMRVKQDVIPGHKIPVWFQAKKTGNFEIACAQLCGLGHYRMRGFFIVETKDKFSAWFEGESVKKLAAAAPAPVKNVMPPPAPAMAGTGAHHA